MGRTEETTIKLVGLYPNMSRDQKKLIRGANYGGLVDIKCSRLHPTLCKYLMQSFDPDSCQMVFPGRGSIPITESSVREVLEIPCGHLKVCHELDSDAIRFMSEQFGNNGSRQTKMRSIQPKMTCVEKKLKGMTKADSNYLRT